MSRRKAEDPPKPENHERWIVTYADMLTLLFALFVVLWSMSVPDATRLEKVRESLNRAFDIGVLSGTSGASPVFGGGGGITPSLAEVKSNDMVEITKAVKSLAREQGLENKIQVRTDADSITISLNDNLLFDSGSAELKPGSQVVLNEVAQALRTLPNEIRVEGHTDNVPVNSPDYPTNWELSAARASTVLRFLTETAGLKIPRLYLAGYADTRPVADNGTPDGRALNRRADLVIVYPGVAAAAAPTPAAGHR